MTKWVRALLIANIAVFFIQMTVGGFTDIFWLYPPQVWTHPWTLLTYAFLHAGFTHILFNMFGLYIFGPNVERRLGANRFLTLYTIGAVGGGLATVFLTPRTPVIGASAALYAVMVAYAVFWPRDKILLYFVVPVEIWMAVLGYAAFDLFGGITGGGTTAHFAHLGGLVCGFVYVRWLAERTGAKKFRSVAQKKVATEVLTNWKRVDPSKVHEVNRDELNRILDKINKSGLASLTVEESRFLMNFVPPDDRPPMVS